MCFGWARSTVFYLLSTSTLVPPKYGLKVDSDVFSYDFKLNEWKSKQIKTNKLLRTLARLMW